MRGLKNGIVICCLLLTASALGWGREGHQIVGSIAEANLNDKAKAAVKDLLGDKSLADVSTWADEIRGDPDYRWAKPLHYVNLPIGASEFNLEQDCPEKGCVVSAILDYSEKLSRGNTSREKKIEALKFLVHFVGDVHQPLHVSYAEDKGGNDIHVRFFNQSTNLHTVWDTMIIRRRSNKWTDLAATLKDGITSQQKADWGVVDPIAWANESYKLAVSNAYDVPPDGTLDNAYYNKNVKIVEEQLSKGGIRLAALLNEIFSKDSTPSPTHEVKFVGSKRSDVYHYPECKVVAKIAAHNLVEYESAPAGKRLHKGCPWK